MDSWIPLKAYWSLEYMSEWVYAISIAVYAARTHQYPVQLGHWVYVVYILAQWAHSVYVLRFLQVLWLTTVIHLYMYL